MAALGSVGLGSLGLLTTGGCRGDEPVFSADVDAGARASRSISSSSVMTVGPRTGSPSGAGATVDVGSLSHTYGLPSRALPNVFRADIGLGTTSSAGGSWTVYYDNVALDWK